MKSKNQPLGRGLAALLGDIPSPNQIEKSHLEITMLELDKIQASVIQPRQHFDETALSELATSIQQHGLMQPITVRPLGNHYEIIAGERRWRACQKLALATIPTIIVTATDEQALALALIENLQRQALNPIEEAIALNRLLEEFHLTHQAIAEILGQSRAHISNQLRLLQLEPEIQQLLAQGKLSSSHARCLVGLDTNTQIAVAEKIQAQQWSVRQTEKWLQERTQAKAPQHHITLAGDHLQWIDEIQKKWESQFKLKPKSQHHGKLIIEYHNPLELEQILKHLRDA